MGPLLFLTALVLLFSLRRLIFRWVMRQAARQMQRRFMNMQNETGQPHSASPNNKPDHKKVGKDLGEYVEFEEITEN